MTEASTTKLVYFIIFNKIAVSTKKFNYYHEPIRELLVIDVSLNVALFNSD